MKIAITGAGGILGSELLHQLQGTEHQVYALTTNKAALVSQWGESVHIHSLLDWENGAFTFQDIDIVIHCAFTRSSNGEHLAQSLALTQKVFQQALKYNCHTINLSSRSVYGQNPNLPWTESTQVIPDNVYALAKYSSELLLTSMFENTPHGVCYTNIRLAGLLTPTFNERIVNKFVDTVINGQPINITGGQQQFAFLDVKDAASAIIQLINSENLHWKTTYNLGLNDAQTILEIAELVVAESAHYKLPKVDIHLNKTDATLYALMDSSNFYNDFNWHPSLSIDKIIKRIFEYKLHKEIGN